MCYLYEKTDIIIFLLAIYPIILYEESREKIVRIIISYFCWIILFQYYFKSFS